MARRKKQMGTFRVDCAVASARQPDRFEIVRKMLVDTGAESSWIPEAVLRRLGVEPAKKDLQFQMANGQVITRSTGFAILRVGEYLTVDEVVFALPGDLALLGARTLGGLWRARGSAQQAAGRGGAAPGGCGAPSLRRASSRGGASQTPRTCERTAGLELDAFFDVWLYQVGNPTSW